MALAEHSQGIETDALRGPFDGLVGRGSAWETPGHAAAPFKAGLAIKAGVGSVTINPEGGCT